MCRMAVLLLAAHTLSPEQRSSIIAGALMTVQALAARASPAAVQRESAAADSGPADSEPSDSAPADTANADSSPPASSERALQSGGRRQLLQRQVAAAGLLSAVHCLLLHAAGDVPPWLATQVQAVLQVCTWLTCASPLPQACCLAAGHACWIPLVGRGWSMCSWLASPLF